MPTMEEVTVEEDLEAIVMVAPQALEGPLGLVGQVVAKINECSNCCQCVPVMCVCVFVCMSESSCVCVLHIFYSKELIIILKGGNSLCQKFLMTDVNV